MINTEHVLAISIATQKIGCAFFIDGTPYDWRVSETASQSLITARDFAADWMEYYQPQLLVTERMDPQSRKGSFSRDINNAIMAEAQKQGIEIMCVDRMQRYANKYAEAKALAERFPELQPYVPKPRRQWESEPRNIGIFVAVGLGLQAIETVD